MRILILNQFFYPDSAATSQLLTDVAWSLAEQGHSVRVICGRSSYAGQEHDLEDNCPPVEIIRSAGMPFARGRFGRIASYFSYLSGATLHSLFGPRPDLVLTLTTPPGLSLVGSLLKIVSGAQHYIWEMDVYPDIALELNVVSRGSWTERLVGVSLDASRRYADGVIALSKSMWHRLVERGIPGDRVHVAENWADGQEIQPERFPEWRPLRILYSGNFGLAHDGETIRHAIRHFADDERFHFSFAGGGSQRAHVEELCHDLAITNVSLLDYCRRNGLSKSLGACHIGLVTQKPATVGAIVPSKTYGLMAAGRAVLYIGPKEGTPARIIERFRCGWQVDPGDAEGLIRLLEELADNPVDVAEAGWRSREAFLANYDRPLGVARVCSILGLSESQAAEATVLQPAYKPANEVLGLSLDSSQT